MKKITLSVAVLANVLAAKAQDTLCTYFSGDNVYEFDYQADTVLYSVPFKLGGENQETQIGKFYQIDLRYGDVLCLDLQDEKNRVRKVITEYFDGTQDVSVLDSKNDTYYSRQGVTRVLVGKPKFAIKL